MAKASKGRRGTKMRKSRKSRRSARKSGASRRRCWAGGANQQAFPASVNDVSMEGPGKLSLAQGGQYESLHQGQHGGAAMSLAAAAPPGYTGMLDDSLRGAARIEPLDQSMQGIQGMSDQSGGRRRNTRRKGSRKGRKGRKGRKSSRRMRGGSAFNLTHAQDVAAPGMLRSPSQEAHALAGMNPEWKLASDPGSFKPQ